MRRIFLHRASLGIIVLACILIAGCASRKEPVPVTVKQPPPPIKKVEKPAQPTPKKDVSCREDTSTNFNFSGIRVLPFLKVAFSDMDSDGVPEMIAGSKKGTLQLYRAVNGSGFGSWKLEKGYFKGIKAGAFSAPSAGDLDGDGRTEIVVGTGGFSSASGRILIFSNSGFGALPTWKDVTAQDLDIGDDAAPAVIDYDFDGHPDIVAANSEGKIFFFRNTSKGRNDFSFSRDTSRQLNRSFDKYAVPAAVRLKDRAVLVIGTSMGKVYKVEMKKNSRTLKAEPLRIDGLSNRFLAPAFVNLMSKDRFDLVVSDGDGTLSYYENRKNNFSAWVPDHSLFNNRLVAGPAAAPTLFTMNNTLYMVVGTIDGKLKLYEHKGGRGGVPWIEKKNYLDGIKVSGFSRGVLTEWSGRDLLITGESNGTIKAFVNKGTRERPSWHEEKKFFKGLTFNYHSTPSAHDLDGDGMWELITGSEEGRLYAYRARDISSGVPEWEMMPGIFDQIRIPGFSVPSFVRRDNTLYLFVGQEDGSIRSFTARADKAMRDSGSASSFAFQEQQLINGITLERHSSPYAAVHRGAIELVAGDYDGNIHHFLCN